jgi:hypothetical protein
MTTTIESGRTSAHQRLWSRSRWRLTAGRGAATSAAWTRLRTPIESQKGSTAD